MSLSAETSTRPIATFVKHGSSAHATGYHSHPHRWAKHTLEWRSVGREGKSGRGGSSLETALALWGRAATRETNHIDQLPRHTTCHQCQSDSEEDSEDDGNADQTAPDELEDATDATTINSNHTTCNIGADTQRPRRQGKFVYLQC